MTPRARLVQELQREGVRLWRSGIALEAIGKELEADGIEDRGVDVETMLEVEADAALDFAARLEALAGRIRDLTPQEPTP